MKQYRVALLRKEFPFVDRLFVNYDGRVILSPEQIDDIKIRKGDNTLLSAKGFVDSYDWSGGGHCDYTTYFAIQGEDVFQLESAGRSGNGSGNRNEWDADTIGEQMLIKKIIPDYIVMCVQNDTDNNGNGTVTRFWTIYKMRQFDLAVYHCKKIDEAAIALKAEIASICVQAKE